MLVLILLMTANFLYNLTMRRKEERLLIYQEAKAITGLFISMQEYISRKQDAINRSPDGSYHFKGLNPETVGRGISAIFNRTSDHRLKMTSLEPRGRDNFPDEFERPVLESMRRNPVKSEYFQSTRIGGETYFYFIQRIEYTQECLQCHGEPKGLADITGYPREGRKIGDFGGAISIRIPARIVAGSTGQDIFILLLFTLFLAGISIYLVAYFLQKISRLSANLADTNLVLNAHNRKLAQLEKIKNDLFHMLIHDMKSPLTFMIGSLQMLQERKVGALNGDQDDLVNLVLRGCNRLENMISNILDINRLEEGKLEFKPEEIRLRELLAERDKAWQRIAQRQQKKFILDYRAAQDHFTCDRNLFERILENLVSNAFKHTYSRKGEVRLIVSDWTEPPGLLFQVADNGEGIPEKYRELIFEKYTIAQEQDLGHKSDTGLGLTFCRMAVEALGGRIWLEPAEGNGTVFSFCLPLLCSTGAAAKNDGGDGQQQDLEVQP